MCYTRKVRNYFCHNYVSNIVIYHPFIYHGISVINIQDSMVCLHIENYVLIHKEHQEHLSNNYVRIFGHLQQFSSFFLD